MAQEWTRLGSARVKSLFPEWEARAEYLTGLPADALVEQATSWNADLIVVGSQGRSALGRLFLGSVSRRVVTEAPCSVRSESDSLHFVTPHYYSDTNIVHGNSCSSGSQTWLLQIRDQTASCMNAVWNDQCAATGPCAFAFLNKRTSGTQSKHPNAIHRNVST